MPLRRFTLKVTGRSWIQTLDVVADATGLPSRPATALLVLVAGRLGPVLVARKDAQPTRPKHRRQQLLLAIARYAGNPQDLASPNLDRNVLQSPEVLVISPAPKRKYLAQAVRRLIVQTIQLRHILDQDHGLNIAFRGVWSRSNLHLDDRFLLVPSR